MRKRLIVLVFILVVFVIWEVLSEASSDVRFFISSPKLSFEYAVENWNNIIVSAGITFLEASIGLIFATGISFLLMILCLYFPSILKVIVPITVTSQVLPIITLAPLFIILFGMGIISKIAMVVLMCFFPIFLNFSSGIDSINSTIKEFLYLYDTKKAFRIFKIIIPLSTPYIFTGLKISTTMALMGAIVAEFVGAKDGLGKNLYLAPKNSLPELMICSIFLVALIGWALFKATVLLEKKIGYWYIN